MRGAGDPFSPARFANYVGGALSTVGHRHGRDDRIRERAAKPDRDVVRYFAGA
jgi:hypothetical protein